MTWDNVKTFIELYRCMNRKLDMTSFFLLKSQQLQRTLY